LEETAMKNSDSSKLGRRDFLRSMGLGTAGLAVAAVTPLATEAKAAESMEEAKKARYNADSEDVKNFYRTNRY
jgi:DMSO/TMAO reductase YedYZ molybdopterin-dependent catalytic subunit